MLSVLPACIPLSLSLSLLPRQLPVPDNARDKERRWTISSRSIATITCRKLEHRT